MLDGDFWQLDIATAWWSTIHVSSIQSFGVQGVSSAGVFPGVKSFHSCDVAASNNNFYIFGGSFAGTPFGLVYVYAQFPGFENHLWRYNFTSTQWTWVKGNQTNQVGYSVGRNIESPLNIPAGRNGHTFNAMTQIDAFLMFGGFSYTSVNGFYLFYAAALTQRLLERFVAIQHYIIPVEMAKWQHVIYQSTISLWRTRSCF